MLNDITLKEAYDFKVFIISDEAIGTTPGIFTQMSELEGTSLPWEALEAPEKIEPIDLDREYYLNHSGRKIISPIVSDLLGDGDTLTTAAKNAIAKLVYSKYIPAWEHLWNSYDVDYNPIHNYNMTEDITRDLDVVDSETVDDDKTHICTETETPNLTDTTNHGRTDTIEAHRYGFNSSDARPTETTEETEGGTTVETHTGTRGNVVNSTEATDTTVDGTKTEDETVHTTRSGNIGVTTTQRMLTEEREVWLWNFFEQIFSDVDKVLTISAYDLCRV